MILVAGGTGHLGRELVPRLLKRGLRVRVLTRDPSRAESVVTEGAEVASGDVRFPHSLRDALTGVESVVSAVTGFGPAGLGPRLIDLQGNLNLIQAAEAAGATRFVLLSMVGAGPGHMLELLRMKHLAEVALRASRLEWTIVRPTVFMELWAELVGAPIRKSGKTTLFGRGDNPINFISVRDIARVVELALTDPRLSRQTIDIGGPQNLTFNQVVQEIERASGRKATAKHIPVPLMRLSSVLMRRLNPSLAGMIRAGVVMDTTDMTFDPTKLLRAYPEIEPTCMAEVIGREFGPPAALYPTA